MPTPKQLLIGAILAALIGLMIGTCNVKPQTDTTPRNTEREKELERQLGYALADAQAQNERAVKAENKARQRDTIYLTRIRTIKEQAPDTCQPYLTAMQSECDTLIKMHVAARLSVDSLVAAKDTVIDRFEAIVKNDVVIIDKLEADNKDKDKKLKRAHLWNKVVTWSALVAIGVVGVVSLIQ